jgi:RimJ/RimL family protein N-acetyltransferase
MEVKMTDDSHVYLKTLAATDLADRHRWLNDREITQYFTTLGALPLPYEKLLQWYQNLNSEREIHFSVFTNSDQHIGGAQLKSIDWKNRSAEFGLFIGEKSFWGKGYCQAITRLLVSYGFETLNLHRLWLRVDAQNKAAFHCYEKCGFRKEGLFRNEVFRQGIYHDSIVMSILAAEWFNGKNPHI